MKVLVIGGGGREHALVWKLRQSSRVEKIICAPGNAGIAEEGAECVAADPKDVAGLLQIAYRYEPDLTVVGPELPLCVGVVDEFSARGMPIFGPTQKAARLESSKSFAKMFMQRHNIPTAHYAVCTKEQELGDALALFKDKMVVKADGLAAGKGVVLAESKADAEQAARAMLTGTALGRMGKTIVLEEMLHGEELSFLVLTDGNNLAPLPPCQDYKRAGDKDTGANTGGMGAYSADSLLDAHMRDWIVTHIAKPTIDGMRAEGVEYRGILYCGLMMTAKGPIVLEFNCRFGDPETQAVLLRLESDLVTLLEDSLNGTVTPERMHWSADASLCVVLASAGYPGNFESGKKIEGLDDASMDANVKVFHAGTKKHNETYMTAGGRVLGVAARGETLLLARDRAFARAAKIHFDGMHYRRDIGYRALAKS